MNDFRKGQVDLSCNINDLEKAKSICLVIGMIFKMAKLICLVI